MAKKDDDVDVKALFEEFGATEERAGGGDRRKKQDKEVEALFKAFGATEERVNTDRRPADNK